MAAYAGSDSSIFPEMAGFVMGNRPKTFETTDLSRGKWAKTFETAHLSREKWAKIFETTDSSRGKRAKTFETIDLSRGKWAKTFETTDLARGKWAKIFETADSAGGEWAKYSSNYGFGIVRMNQLTKKESIIIRAMPKPDGAGVGRAGKRGCQTK